MDHGYRLRHLGMQWRIDQWSGVREYSLAPEEKSVPESIRQADAGETVSFEEVMAGLDDEADD